MPRLPLKLPRPALPHRILSDRDLISACLKGDNAAWDMLIDRYAALLYSVCLKMGLSGADSEDVVQDVCVILLDHLADLRDDAKLASWLISTARREVWRFQRRKGLKLASELGDDDWALDAGSPLFGPSGESPETALLAMEEQQMVRQGMERMPERCRRLLTLLYGTESPPSYVQIATDFAIPFGSIGPTRARCLQQLRKLLAEIGY